MSLSNLDEPESRATGDVQRLEKLQDDVLHRLDELNEQIEVLLSSLSNSKGAVENETLQDA